MLPDSKLIHPVTYQNHLVIGPIYGAIFHLHLLGVYIIFEPYIAVEYSADADRSLVYKTLQQIRMAKAPWMVIVILHPVDQLLVLSVCPVHQLRISRLRIRR
jgi:hypothetical protein